MKRANLALISAVLVPLTLGVAGCKSDNHGGSLPMSTHHSSGGAASTGAASGGNTEPGATLAVGEPATVRTKSLGGRTATVTLTLTSIDAGDPADLGAIDFGDQSGDLAGRTPYYLRFTVTGGDGADALAGDDLDGSAFTGIEPDGSQAAWLQIPAASGFSQCVDPGFPDEFGAGGSADICFPVLASEGGSVAGVAYSQSGSEYDGNNGGKPIIWKK